MSMCTFQINSIVVKRGDHAYSASVGDGILTLSHSFITVEMADTFVQVITEALKPPSFRWGKPLPYRGVMSVSGSSTEFEIEHIGREWTVTGDDGLPHRSRSFKTALKRALRG